MKKARNKKIDGRFYTDEYIGILVKRIYELETRIDKAIEYIKQLDYTIDGIIYNKKTQQCIGIDDLLDILRGENNESN